MRHCHWAKSIELRCEPLWTGEQVKRCELPLFLAALGPAMRGWKALDLGSLNIQFQHDWPKDENITAVLFFAWNLEKYCSTELYGAPLEGSTIFLYRSSTCSRALLDSCGLVELKYALFSRTGRNTKKLRRLKLFLSMVFKHGLLEGSTFLFQYSFITHKKFESSRLGEFKYAPFSRIWPKREEWEPSKAQKNDILRQAYMVTVVWAAQGIDIIISIQLLKPCTVG